MQKAVKMVKNNTFYKQVQKIKFSTLMTNFRFMYS